jgi:hypothetical protein
MTCATIIRRVHCMLFRFRGAKNSADDQVLRRIASIAPSFLGISNARACEEGRVPHHIGKMPPLVCCITDFGHRSFLLKAIG